MKRFLLIPLCLAVFAMGLLGSCESSGGDSSTNSDGESDVRSSSTNPWNSSVSYGVLSYGGQAYKTVTIGTQTWMAENLSYKVDSSFCYANSVDSCKKYGRLYQWAAVMGLDASYNSKVWSGTLPRQGICPSGWHVPSDAEWNTLVTFIGGDSKAGAKLKSNTGWEYVGIQGNGLDSYGFRALPAGYRLGAGSNSVGYATGFWSSSEIAATVVRYRILNGGYESMIRDDVTGVKRGGVSVRCIKD